MAACDWIFNWTGTRKCICILYAHQSTRFKLLINEFTSLYLESLKGPNSMDVGRTDSSKVMQVMRVRSNRCLVFLTFLYMMSSKRWLLLHITSRIFCLYLKVKFLRRKILKRILGPNSIWYTFPCHPKIGTNKGIVEALKRSTPGRCSGDLVHIYLDSEVTERKEKYLARGNDVG